MVRAWGMTVETASEGQDALNKLSQFAADVIITDLSMPGMDGFTFLQKLRESGEMPPTIVFTAFGNVETAVRTVHEYGAYWFLEKPFAPNVMEALVRQAGSLASLNHEKRAGTPVGIQRLARPIGGYLAQNVGNFRSVAGGGSEQSLRPGDG